MQELVLVSGPQKYLTAGRGLQQGASLGAPPRVHCGKEGRHAPGGFAHTHCCLAMAHKQDFDEREVTKPHKACARANEQIRQTEVWERVHVGSAVLLVSREWSPS